MSYYTTVLKKQRCIGRDAMRQPAFPKMYFEEGPLKFTICTHVWPEVFKIYPKKDSLFSGEKNKQTKQNKTKKHLDKNVPLIATKFYPL